MLIPMTRRDEAASEEVAVGARIAKNLGALLRATGWTQGQLAYKAGLTQAAISQLSQGRRRPSLQSIWQISQAFGVSMEELAGFKPLRLPDPVEPEAPADRLEALEKRIAVLSDLPNQVQQMAEAMADLLESRSSSRRPKQRSEADKRSA